MILAVYSTYTPTFLPQNAGSGWVENTLTLNYGPFDGSGGGTEKSTVSDVSNFIPTDAIGIFFNVSRNTTCGRTSIGVQGWPNDHFDFIAQHQAITLQDDSMDFTSSIKLSLFHEHFDDIPEITENGITKTDFLFIQEVIDAPILNFGFYADGRGNPGTTIYSDVSWIIADGLSQYPYPYHPEPPPAPIPEPSTWLFLLFGLTGLAGIKKKIHLSNKYLDK